MNRYYSAPHRSVRQSTQSGRSSEPARHKARRRAGKRTPILSRTRLRVFAWCLALVAAACCVTGVYRSPLVAVRHVSITGLGGLLPEEAAAVQNAAALPAGTNIFHVRTGRMEGALSRVPSVESARVARRLPDRVEISIVPRVPVAILACAGTRWELDAAGFAIRAARLERKLVEIALPFDCSISAGQHVDIPGVAGALVAAALATHGTRLEIAKIEVDQNADICLNMADKVAIRIGHTDKLDTKLALVRRIYEERPDIGAEVEAIDLRCPDAPACLPRGTAQHASGLTQGIAAHPADLRKNNAPSVLEPTTSNNHREIVSTQDSTESAVRPRASRISTRSSRSAHPKRSVRSLLAGEQAASEQPEVRR